MAKNSKKIKKGSRPAKRKSVRSSWMLALADIPHFVHFLVIFILLIILFLLFMFSDNKTDSLYKEAKKISEEGKVLTLRHNVFGDHYVNNLAIDTNLTNFYFDSISTAFMFEPDYRWLDKGVCRDSYCELDPIDWNFPGRGEKEYCLGINCLSLRDNNLFFNDIPLSYPRDISGQEIKRVSIYPLNNDWLLGFVFQDDNLEKGLVYRFNGEEFINLYPENDFPFVSRENYEGAVFGFGGDSNNFLVIYGGYDLLGYQVLAEKKIDISRFLGLRVSGGGFSPVAYKKTDGQETIWYLCSLDENKPRLIKLWQNKSESIKGSLALTEVLLEDRESADSAWCRLGDSNNLEVLIEKKGKFYKRSLEDNGFIQLDNYSLLTKNLLQTSGQMEQATFNNLLACDDQGCDGEVLNNSLSFSVSGNGQDYFSAQLAKEIMFPDKSPGMYYQLEARGKIGDKHYSPWIDGLTAISYSWWE